MSQLCSGVMAHSRRLEVRFCWVLLIAENGRVSCSSASDAVGRLTFLRSNLAGVCVFFFRKSADDMACRAVVGKHCTRFGEEKPPFGRVQMILADIRFHFGITAILGEAPTALAIKKKQFRQF